jgi:hypothetical protein
MTDPRLPRSPQINPPAPFRILLGIFGLVFAGAGICVLGLIWGDRFDFVPVFAKLFGSLIACALLAFGGFMVFSAVAAGKVSFTPIATIPTTGESGKGSTTSPGRYVCPNCGAALGEKADVSPMGDVKCAHCGRWFNVHNRM